MTELKVLSLPYSCRTDEWLYYKETRKVIQLLVNDHMEPADIKKLNKEQNIFNAVTARHSNDICIAVLRRIASTDDDFRRMFLEKDVDTQKVMCVMMIMLTNHTFYDFMDHIYKEKLILNDNHLTRAEVLSFMHELQNRDDKASKWIDKSIKKFVGVILSILSEAGMIARDGKDYQIRRPILTADVVDLLKSSGLQQIYNMLLGERS
ncbi:DUF1819 family protein [Galactobacillus timonensis]|uniref:DUF1819 family protein n=1 Tax=Galactobacillus timonensis TaxID=2041840 RepID=UPI000C853FEE|nr:DUF1819 family protein [Galactobacillus timonensis]